MAGLYRNQTLVKRSPPTPGMGRSRVLVAGLRKAKVLRDTGTK